MDKDRIVGSAKEIKGDVKQAVGKAVGDAKLESEGQADKVRGVARLVGIEGGVVSGVFHLESSDVEASDRRPRHDDHYHEA